MRTMLDYVFGWEVFSFGVGLLLLAGSLMVSDEFKKYPAAKILFCLAAIWIFGKVLMWSFFTSEKFTVRTTIAFLVCGFVGAGLAEAMHLIGEREAKGKIAQEKEKVLPPPVMDLQAGRHIEVNDSKIIAHEGSAVRTGKGINDLSFNKTIIEGGVKTGIDSKDASAAPIVAITPKIPYQESSPEEIAVLRKRATVLIKGLFTGYADWREREKEWLDKKNEDKADEVSKEFTAEYDKNYKQKVIKARDSLLRNIKQWPKRALDVETSYKSHGEFIFPQDVQGQLCDLIVLLNQLEKENNLEISCSDVKQKIPFCDEHSMD